MPRARRAPTRPRLPQAKLGSRILKPTGVSLDTPVTLADNAAAADRLTGDSAGDPYFWAAGPDATGTASGLQVTLPDGLDAAQDDVVYVAVTARSPTTTVPTLDAISGWTQWTQPDTAATQSLRIAVYTRKYQGGDPTSVTITGTSVDSLAAKAFGWRHSTAPTNGVGYNDPLSSGGTTGLQGGPITVGAADSWAVMFTGTRSGETVTPDAVFTELAEVHQAALASLSAAHTNAPAGAGAHTYSATLSAGTTTKVSYVFELPKAGAATPITLPDSGAGVDRLDPAGLYRAEVAADTPAAWWHLDETSGTQANDAVGVAHGTYTGGPTLGVASLAPTDPGTAVTFVNTGTSQYVEIPDQTALNPGSVTVEALISPSSWNGNNRIIQKGAADNQYRLLVESGQLKWEVAGHALAVGPVPSVARHHLAGTYDAATGIGILYVDGVEVGRQNGTSGAEGPAADALFIGQKSAAAPAGDGFPGALDEPAVYAVSLSPARVVAHARAAGFITLSDSATGVDLLQPAAAAPLADAGAAADTLQVDTGATPKTLTDTGQAADTVTVGCGGGGPDAILTTTNLTGPVTSLCDDPASPDGLWLTAPTQTAPTDLRLSFPTPTVAPGSGGPTTFTVLVRRPATADPDPTVVLELWEAGSFVRQLTTTAVSSTGGQLVVGTLNPAELTDPSGAGVELRVRGVPA